MKQQLPAEVTSNRIKTIWKNQNGGVYMMSLILLFVLFIFGTSTIIIMEQSTRRFSRFFGELKAQALAEAGIDRAVVNILLKDNNKNWTDNQNRLIYTNEMLGNGRYSVQTNQGNSNSISLTATGDYQNTQKTIRVTVTIDWEKIPPAIRISDWKLEATR